MPIELQLYGDPVDLISNIYLTEKEKQIVTLTVRGLDRHDICQLLGITRNALRVRISRMKKKAQE